MIQANEATLKNLSDDREAMKLSIRGLRAKIEQLAGERERAEKDSLEHTRLWQERAEGLKAQGVQVTKSRRACKLHGRVNGVLSRDKTGSFGRVLGPAS